jgi:hypothetical protein
MIVCTNYTRWKLTNHVRHKDVFRNNYNIIFGYMCGEDTGLTGNTFILKLKHTRFMHTLFI